MVTTSKEWSARRKRVRRILLVEPVSNAEVSRRLGIDFRAVAKIRAELGVPVFGTPAATDEEIAAVLRAEAVSNRDLAARLGVNRARVARVREELGQRAFNAPAADWEQIARLLKTEDVSNREAARRLGVSAEYVARVRADLGLPVYVRRGELWTPEAWNQATRKIRGGHRLWLGRTSADLTPMVDGNGLGRRSESAYRLGFRLHYGRDAVGRLLATCTQKWCVEATHREDRVMREAWPAELPLGATWRGLDLVAIRAALGRPAPYPPLDLAEQKAAARYAPKGMASAELARRLGCCERSAALWRKAGTS